MLVFFKRIQLKKNSQELSDLVANLELELFGENGEAMKIFDNLNISNKFKLFFYSASTHHMHPKLSQFFEEYIINRALPKEIDL